MFLSAFNIFVFVIIFSYDVEALTTEELKEQYAQMIIDCLSEYSITGDDLEQLKNKVMPDNERVRCLFACAYRKAGMMNDKGELSVEGINEMTQRYFSDDPEKVKKSVEFTNACKSVNDVTVSDGDKGCERAALIFKCTVEKSPQFDFV